MKLKLALMTTAAFAYMATANADIRSSNNAALFTANLNLKSVTHKLNQAGNANAAHPFYKKFCKNSKPVAYDNASGSGTFWYDAKHKTLYFAFSYQGLSASPIMMHFHVAAAGKSGPIVQTICGNPPPNKPSLGYSHAPLVSAYCPRGRTGYITGHYRLRGNKKLNMSVSDEVAQLKSGKLYLNIHTCLNEAGELRGQIIPLK